MGAQKSSARLQIGHRDRYSEEDAEAELERSFGQIFGPWNEKKGENQSRQSDQDEDCVRFAVVRKQTDIPVLFLSTLSTIRAECEFGVVAMREDSFRITKVVELLKWNNAMWDTMTLENLYILYIFYQFKVVASEILWN